MEIQSRTISHKLKDSTHVFCINTMLTIQNSFEQSVRCAYDYMDILFNDIKTHDENCEKTHDVPLSIGNVIFVAFTIRTQNDAAAAYFHLKYG